MLRMKPEGMIAVDGRSYRYELTNDREPFIEVFAPEGYVFGGELSSLLCVSKADALERIRMLPLGAGEPMP